MTAFIAAAKAAGYICVAAPVVVAGSYAVAPARHKAAARQHVAKRLHIVAQAIAPVALPCVSEDATVTAIDAPSPAWDYSAMLAPPEPRDIGPAWGGGSWGDDVALGGSHPGSAPPVLPPASRVPEVGVWAMMVAGFGFVGAMMRRKGVRT